VLLAQRRWVRAPVRQTPLQHRHRRLLAVTMAGRRPEGLPAVTMAGRRPEGLPAVTMAGRRPEGLLAVTMAGRRLEGLLAVTMAGRRRETSTARADPVGPGTSMARADRAGPAHGVGIPSVATSTGLRGETDPHPGDGVRRRGRRGADRSRRPGDSGWVAQSTTGATRKRPCGIPRSTSGASGSSGSGSRCRRPAHATPALPVGEAGVGFG
jgi:hypothetical protein